MASEILIGAIALPLAGWVVKKVTEHDKTIAILMERSENVEQTVTRVEEKLDRILEAQHGER